MRVFHSPPSSENQTRTRILQAAQRLFAAKGFEGTTTRDLAQIAGVAEGTLFRHFANKKQFWWKWPLVAGSIFSQIC